MPSNNNIDDILINKFENFEAPLPKGGFGSIKGRIPEKRRRGLLLPFLAAASIFFATLSGYLFLKQFDKVDSNQKLSTQKQDLNTSTTVNQTNIDSKVIALNSNNNNSIVKTGQSTRYNNSSNNNLSNGTSNQVINSSFENLNKDNTITNNGSINLLPSHNNSNLLANAIIENSNSNSLSYINSMNDGLSPILLRHIILAETDGANRKLTGSIDLELETISNEKEDEDEEKENSKYHYGVSVSPIYTSKRLSSNEGDETYVRNFKNVNEVSTNKSGISAAFILSREITDRLEIFTKVDISNLRDENKFDVLEKLDAPELISTNGNSMTLTSYKTKQIENQSSYIYSGLNAGVKYKIGNSSYVGLGNGLHYLLGSKDSNPDAKIENNKMNFSSAFSIGRSYNINEKLTLAVEPELKLFYKAFQQNGVYQSKPYTIGLNFVLMR